MQNLLDFKSVFYFAADPQAIAQAEKVAQSFALPLERAHELNQLAAAVIKGEVEYAQMPTLLSAAFGTDEAKAKLIAADLAGYRLLPLQLYLPGIKEAILGWGGKIESYPTTIVPKEKVTPEALIEQFAQKLSLTLPEHLMKRFAYLCRGYLMGERTREGTMVLFKRPINVGGLEMSDAQTLSCLTLLDEQKQNVEVVEMELGTQHEHHDASPVVPVAAEEEPAVESTESEPTPVPILEVKPVDVHHELVKTVTQAVTTSVPTISGEMIEHQEKKEVEQAKKQIAAAEIVSADDVHQKNVDAAVGDAYVAVGDLLKKKRVSKQDFTDLAVAHVRGRREYHQTESLFKDRFGLVQEEADEVMKILEMERKIVAGSTGSLDALPASRTFQGVQKTPDLVSADTSILDARFAAITKHIPDASIESVMPNARVSAARTKEEELALQAEKIDPGKATEAEQASKPEKAQVLVSSASAPLAAHPAEVVTDVQYMPNLVGPVEELGVMTPEQFRRLSSDPMQAIQKIQDKLSLLEGVSFADRIRGVEAWRKSPTSLLYLSMSREALMAGISLAELAAKRRSAGQESLSPAEIAAIVELNRRIGF